MPSYFRKKLTFGMSPNLRGDPSFELHAGTKARVLEDYQEWARIELANGAQGWVKNSAIRKL